MSQTKESVCNAGDQGSIAGPGRSPEERHGYPLQCFCLEKSMDRGAWRATVQGVPKSWTRLSRQHFYFTFIKRSGRVKVLDYEVWVLASILCKFGKVPPFLQHSPLSLWPPLESRPPSAPAWTCPAPPHPPKQPTLLPPPGHSAQGCSWHNFKCKSCFYVNTELSCNLFTISVKPGTEYIHSIQSEAGSLQSSLPELDSFTQHMKRLEPKRLSRWATSWMPRGSQNATIMWNSKGHPPTDEYLPKVRHCASFQELWWRGETSDFLKLIFLDTVLEKQHIPEMLFSHFTGIPVKMSPLLTTVENTIPHFTPPAPFVYTAQITIRIWYICGSSVCPLSGSFLSVSTLLTAIYPMPRTVSGTE